MSDPIELKRALEVAASGAHPVDARLAAAPLEDLVRGQSARKARTRRRVRAGLSGLVVAAVLGVGVAGVLDRSTEPATQIHLVARQLDATPYTFDLTPKGWSVQAQTPTAVTIAPDDGSTSDNPDDFIGKLVVLFDRNPLSGRKIEHAGRTIWITASSGYVTMSTISRAGEPAGVVRIQYPKQSGWSTEAMTDFLASVHVGPGARPGVG